ncbi:hypothetical protein [Saccharibacillus brassicae]|uniref:Uncharacterized protein n=1 Tax=Saccharibacillus brassicae TaxID=2583377 RepID=A0A4Y6V138_SACBS|nr:hypothetical protein [Saccharibacillus brassicae]QDH22311.1 hypothetical protein FFV09_16530 [Saccharibacillus brassicae]
MPEQTTNLNLPIPLGNENVNRQFFLDLIQAVDKGAVSERQLTEAIGKVAIALTQDYASTDQATAISADAVRRGLETKQNTVRLADNYLAASALINAAPDAQNRAYPDSFSFFKVSSAAGGWPTSNGYVMTMRAGSGGVQLYFEMYMGNVQSEKTARIWTRSKRDANGFWQEWNRTLTEADRALLTTWSNSVADTRMTNAAPNTYAQGVTREFKVGSAIGLPGEAWVLLTTEKPWVDVAGGLPFQFANGGTTGLLYYRTSNGTTESAGWASWIDLVADVRLEKISSIELRRQVPGDGPAFIDFHTSAEGVDFNARIIAENTSTKGNGQGRLTLSAQGGIYADGPLFVQGTDLKKSVSDGKAAVRAAITGKGGTVADADGDGVPTHVELAAGVNSIVRSMAGVVRVVGNTSSLASTLGAEMAVASFPAGLQSHISFFPTRLDSGNGSYAMQYDPSQVDLRITDGVNVIHIAAPPGYGGFITIAFDFGLGVATIVSDQNNKIRTGIGVLNRNLPLRIYLYRKATNGTTVYCGLWTDIFYG